MCLSISFWCGFIIIWFITFILMIGYDTISSTLAIILPVSVLISFLQIIYKSQLNKKLIFEYNIYTLKFYFLIFFLIFSIKTNYFDIKIFVSFLLIISRLFINRFFKNK